MSQNFDNATNPYQVASRPIDDYSGSQALLSQMPMNSSTKVICIIFLIFGILGVLGGLMQIAVVVGVSVISANAEQLDKATNDALMQMNRAFNPLTIGLMVVSLMVSILMTAGGFGGLRRKLWGAKLIRYTAGFMSFFKFVEVGAGIYTQVSQMDEQRARMREQMKNAPGVDADTLLNVSLGVGIAFGAAFALMLVGFYIWSYLHMGKPQTLAQFS